MCRLHRIVSIALLLCLAEPGMHAAPPVTRKTAATGVSLPLFGSDRTVPAATVKIESLTIGARRQGFFRVGILPLVVGDGVKIIFKKPDAAALADLPATIEALTKCTEFELKEVRFLAPEATEPCLTAGLVRVDGKGAWQLSNLVLPPDRAVAKAKLQVSGEKAGELTFDENGSTTRTQLFTTP